MRIPGPRALEMVALVKLVGEYVTEQAVNPALAGTWIAIRREAPNVRHVEWVPILAIRNRYRDFQDAEM